MSAVLFTILILLVGIERLVELAVSRRNAAWAFAHGGVETARRQMPWMVALHAGLLVGALAEVWLLGRPFVAALGWSMLAIVVGCQAARWWIVAALGPRWNTRVIVVPGMASVADGPYRFGWMRHPNYLVVAIEGVALPLVHSAWVTAVSFTALNAVLLLGFRIPAEERALAEAAR